MLLSPFTGKKLGFSMSLPVAPAGYGRRSAPRGEPSAACPSAPPNLALGCLDHFVTWWWGKNSNLVRMRHNLETSSAASSHLQLAHSEQFDPPLGPKLPRISPLASRMISFHPES